MPTKKPRRPDIDKKLAEIDAWIEGPLTSYLIYLLDQAQAKLTRSIEVYADLNRCDFVVERQTEWHSDRFHEYLLYDEDSLCSRKFPELVEFMRIRQEVSDKIYYDIGALKPTVPPKKTTKTSL